MLLMLSYQNISHQVEVKNASQHTVYQFLLHTRLCNTGLATVLMLTNAKLPIGMNILEWNLSIDRKRFASIRLFFYKALKRCTGLRSLLYRMCNMWQGWQAVNILVPEETFRCLIRVPTWISKICFVDRWRINTL